MSYEINKAEVSDFFDNHIMKYVVKDLEVLNSIEPDASGAGGCAIPQAISTFAALDLIGYLTHPQDKKPVFMNFTDLLKNDTYFPEFKQYSSHANFFDSFRDNLRSIMAHRFSLAKYDITKTDTGHLFIEERGRQIFSASYFTKMTINAIKKIYSEIKNDTFIINGYSKEQTIDKIKDRLVKLRDYEGDGFASLRNLPSSTTETRTTSSLG